MNTGKKIDNLLGNIPEVKNTTSTKIIEDTAEKTLLITENAGFERDKNEKLEKLRTDDSLLDVFRVNNNGEIEVKHNSNILSGHFKGAPLVPGVILKKLYETITGIKLGYGNKSISFDGMVVPGHKIVVKEDGIYLRGAKVLSINENHYNIPFINNDKKNPTPIGPKYNSDKKLDYYVLQNVPSDYLLQSDPILLAKSCIIKIFDSTQLSVGDEITGEIDSKMLDKNGNLDSDFLSEGAAQVLSAGVSFMKNGGVNLDNKGGDFEIMTFSSLLSKNYEQQKYSGSKITVKAITSKVDRREITAEYVIKDNTGNILQSGIISGRPIKKKLLDKNIEKLTNEINIEMLIEKSNKSIKESGLYNCLSINKEKLTIKSKINFKLFKSLYLEIYNSTDFAELNKEQFNTDICEGDVLDIRLDGLYRDGKEILKTQKKRLDENSKLREIFTVDRNRVIINPVFYSSFENEEEYIKYINENIEIYLSELQIVLTQEKVKINGENATHKINNIYTPSQEIYFDENGIYSLENGEKKYYFMNDKILIIKNIIESNLEKYFSAYSNTEIKINSKDGEVKEGEIVLLKLAILRLFKKIYGISKTKLINDKLIGFGKIIKINEDGLYIDSEKIL